MSLRPPDAAHELIDELLAEQRQLTAVDRFASRHESGEFSSEAGRYADLIPLSKPEPGQQYAFEVDLDKCSGCKACVSACHSLNGLDEGETWRETGLLFSADWRQPFQQTVTTACHHCVEPACLEGCPVLAYDKDPVTGIVRHLDDQCIGCQYCVMKCPYEVPKYSAKRGIVRKCDMCASRLAVGEAPACAQACPSQAIRITIVEQSQVADFAKRGNFLPATPDPRLTLPSTRYHSTRLIPADLLAGDHARVKPSDPHLPLVFMLVFTQFSVGASVAAIFSGTEMLPKLLTLVSVAVALGIATLHLGRPLQAWRAFLGWRRSWFSREIIVFGAYVTAAAACCFAAWRPGGIPSGAFLGLRLAVAFLGLAGVACSAMIYADTGRDFWSAAQCFGKFFGTTILLGAGVELALSVSRSSSQVTGVAVSVSLMLVTTIAKLGLEHRIFRHLVDENTPTLTAHNKTARLLAGELGLPGRTRIAFGIVGGCALPLLLLLARSSGHFPELAVAMAALVFCVAGEYLERYLFFRAVVTVKMPGGFDA